jgi:hypothetical protein
LARYSSTILALKSSVALPEGPAPEDPVPDGAVLDEAVLDEVRLDNLLSVIHPV